MEFAFTEEQMMVRESTENFLTDVSSSEQIRTSMETESGFDPATWQKLCEELYLQAVTIPEEFGGMGLGFVELAAIMEKMGQVLFCAPYFSSVCLATTAINLAASHEQKIFIFDKLLAGETATFAFTQSGSMYDSSAPVIFLEQEDHFVLNGEYRFVVDGHTADHFILSAQTEQGEIALFYVPKHQEGLEVKWQPTMDQTRKLASITVNNCTVPKTALMLDRAESVVSKIKDIATILLAAEQVGGAQKVLDLAVDYTKERVQFNRPVASFQSVKHKAADMMTKVEAARSGLYYAACIAEEASQQKPLGAELAEAASLIKANCSEAFFQNAGDAIQLHGGVGFTWEYDVHLYFKRAKASEHFLGDATYHRERLATLILDSE